MSARRPLIRLFLTGSQRRLCRQWGDERRTCTTEENDIVFTDESRFCLQHRDGRIRVWRQPCLHVLPLYHQSKMLVQRLARETPPAATPD
ncbi:transposable element Tcb1 transposase [Trichonephila clavipes]|nr:transposable element Tcb1 transposase [Trichonephila clavipes]